jgi:TPR repeat protein
MFRLLLIALLAVTITACASIPYSPNTSSQLRQGKRDFDDGFYQRSLHRLLPLACDGNPEAQYAVGYMYYYGFGVAQDPEVGSFWIRRSSAQHYQPAIDALELIDREKAKSTYVRKYP